MYNNTLDKAVYKLGIYLDYYDALGGYYNLSEENKLKFLSIFGINDIEKDFAKMEETEWLTPLEPIYVIRKDKSEFRIFFRETVDFDYSRVKLFINKQEFPIDSPGKSEEYKLLNDTIYHKHYFNIPKLDIGYHSLELIIDNRKYSSKLVISPSTCYYPESLKTGKVLGVASHLYSIYSDTSQGIGDFSDLKALLKKIKVAGGDMLLNQPWHYTSILKNDTTSPYYPLSRLFINPLYIDTVALGIKLKDHPNLGAYVNYNKVIDYKIPALKKYFQKHKTDKEFLRYIKGNDLLDKFACFCTLYEKFSKWSWKDWDSKYQSPNSKGIKEFSKEHKEELLFHKFLQYLASKQLTEAYDTSKDLDMKIGLCNDLAVGAGHHSFEAWFYGKRIFVQDAEVGAPADEMDPNGQSWGFPPYNPVELKKSAYESYIEILSKNMKNTGALRLDHAMHTMRLFWNIGKEFDKSIGSYVAMNMEELLGIIALESHLNECIVIAEDLGTVADGFRERMKEENILTTKEVYFETDENDHYKKPEDYEKISMCTIHTHDTATIRGFLANNDLEIQQELGIIDKKTFNSLKEERQIRLKELQERYNLTYKSELKTAFNDILLRSNSCISLVYLEDITDDLEQINLPGTTTEHKNWNKKLSSSLEDLDIKF